MDSKKALNELTEDYMVIHVWEPAWPNQKYVYVQHDGYWHDTYDGDTIPVGNWGNWAKDQYAYEILARAVQAD